MFDIRQLQGLFGGAMPQRTPLQGLGLQSPFLTERPQQALPTQGFMPSRGNAMSPNAMAMLGMNPNMPNMVGPTSALPAEMQPQASQLRMWGMEDQMSQPPAAPPRLLLLLELQRALAQGQSRILSTWGAKIQRTKVAGLTS